MVKYLGRQKYAKDNKDRFGVQPCATDWDLLGFFRDFSVEWKVFPSKKERVNLNPLVILIYL